MGVVDKPDKDGEEDRGCVVEFVQEEDRVVEGFAEVRKSFTERFSRVSEQIGELRSMILERDKSIQEIEKHIFASNKKFSSMNEQNVKKNCFENIFLG